MSGVRGRFAPSPSGRMHLGNVCCALAAWLSVRQDGGEMVLRMEDLDPDRCRREYGELLIDDLRWLGLDWDEGPGKEGACGPYWQSARRDRYEQALQTLRGRGELYPCYCTRAQLHAASAPHRGDGVVRYPGTCRSLSARERAEREKTRAPALRWRVPEGTVAFDDQFLGPQAMDVQGTFGDLLLRRSDGVHAYQLAVTVDDMAMGITQVVRGNDLLASTPCQILLMRALGGKEPRYGHVPLLVTGDGRRLSKREKDLDMGVLRQRYTPEQLCGKLANLLGMLDKPEPVKARELIGLLKREMLQRDTLCIRPQDWTGEY